MSVLKTLTEGIVERDLAERSRGYAKVAGIPWFRDRVYGVCGRVLGIFYSGKRD